MNPTNPQFGQVHELIKTSRARAARAVNRELIILYWSIGEYIAKKIKNEEWGDSVVEKLSDYLQEREPKAKGFSARNLWRMKQFYEEYQASEQLANYLTQLPWSSHLHLLSKTSTLEEKSFYLRMAVEERYSVRDLARQINRGLFETHQLSIQTIPEKTKNRFPELLNIFKEVYVFDFLKLPNNYGEKDLQKAIIRHLKKFILELGNDFTYIDQEFRISIGATDFFIDLLFMHRTLGCVVAFELKVSDFKPEHVGKMSFYLSALDLTVKKSHENPSIGIIICQDKDLDVVKTAIANIDAPILVSSYRLELIGRGKLRSKLKLILNDKKFGRTIASSSKQK